MTAKVWKVPSPSSINPLGAVMFEVFELEEGEELLALQSIVGGPVENIATSWLNQHDVFLYANEDGQALNLPINPVASSLAEVPIVGDAVLFAVINHGGDEDEFLDITTIVPDPVNMMVTHKLEVPE